MGEFCLTGSSFSQLVGFVLLDTLFTESDLLFIRHWIENYSSQLINLAESIQSTSKEIGAIEKTDPFLSSVMIEFSLMAIDMLFTKTDDALEGLLPKNFKEDQNV